MSAPRLTIVVPCYNEGARIERTAAAIERFLDDASLEAEVILVDDGSADDTGALIDQIVRDSPRFRAEALPENRGKGAAVARGIARARAPYVVFFDADLAYSLETVLAILERLEAGADLAIGARDLDEGRARYTLSRRAASHLFSTAVAVALDLGEVRDTQCGIKGFRSEHARELFARSTIRGFGFDIEILARARAWGLRVERVPARMRATGGGSSVRLVRDSLSMLSDLGRVWWDRRTGRHERPAVRQEGEPE